MIKVAAVQMCSGLVLADNLVQAAELLAQAAQQGATLALLPENFPLMGLHEEDKFSIAENVGSGPIQAFLAAQAQLHKMTIIGGTLPARSHETDRVYAQVAVFDKRGDCIARYNKLHLFDVHLPDGAESYQESRGIVAGNDIVCVDCPVGSDAQIVRAGLSVCYDLRFPELYRQLTALGATVLVVPSAFTDRTGRAHWLTLLRARAIENQCFVIAANQGGEHANGRKTFGHSVIIDPWGEIMAQTGYGVGVVVAELDLTKQRELRARFPVLQHQRIGIGALKAVN